MIIWLIGMSGTGKTTIGRELWQNLRDESHPTVFLDGDILRDVWGDSLGYTVEARAKNAHRISHLCRMLDVQGFNVVACVLSIFPEWLNWNREHFSNYFEVFIDTPLEVLETLDDKGLYAKARRGELSNVVGIDIPFPVPACPDLAIDNTRRDRSPSQLADEIFRHIQPQLRE